MADYYQVKNQNIFSPPANTSLGNATNQFNTMYVENDLILGNVTVTGDTIIAPKVSSITYPGDDTAADTAGGQTITLTGSGFVAGASVLINGSAVGVVSVVSSTSITFTSPANSTGSYVIYVVNPDGSTAIAVPGIQYSGTPTWTTAAGTLGNVYETASFNQTVTATGDAPITYSVTSGSIPPGSTFNANGTITGTSQLTASPTTYSFTVRATDAEAQDTDRAFSISVIPDVVTWSNPTANATYTPAANIAIANITLSATSAVGSGITYSANTLPTGLSLTGANISGTPTVVANTSSLLTATANTTSESSSITINWVVSVASDPYFMYNSLLLPGTGTNGAQNNTFLDGSTNNFAITRNGNTTQGTFTPYGANWSSYNGDTNDSGFGFNTNAALNMGTGDFTIEAWVNTVKLPTVNSFQTSSGGYQGIIATGPSQSATGTALYIGTTNLKFDITSDGSGPIDIAHNMVPGTWYHVAVSRSGNTFRAFINGSLVQTATSSASWNDGYGWGIQRIEPVGGFSGSWWYGYVSNFRAVKGTAVYTSAFTPSTTPLTAISGTSLLTCQSNRFKDNSSNNFSPVFSPNPPTIQRYSPFSPTAAYSTSTIGGSGYFDGSGDFLSVPHSTSLELGSGDFTIEAWIYLTKYSPGWSGVYASAIMSKDEPTGRSWFWDVRGTASSYTTMEFGGGAGPYDAGQSYNFALNCWHHVAISRSGTTLGWFVNGTRIGTTTTSQNFSSGSSALRVGQDGYTGYTYDFPGYISDTRIVKGTAVYSGATYTVPTAPLTAITNTQFLCNLTNAGIIDNTMLNNLETVGNAQISTAQTKFGSGSMSFDGNGDYLSMPANPTNRINTTGNFTIEFWAYFNTVASDQRLIAWDNNSSNFVIALYTTTSGVLYYYLSSTGTSWNIAAVVPMGNISATTWTHIAFVRNGSVFTPYINGIAGTTTTSSATLTASTLPFVIGAAGNGTSPFNGYMDDFRITKGYARYTSNFTPATSAFPTY